MSRLSAEHESEQAEHEDLCRELYYPDGSGGWRPVQAPKLYRLSIEHRGRKVPAFVVSGDVKVFTYVDADRLPSCRGYVETPVSELRAGDKFISADRVWTLTAVTASEP